MRNRWLRIQVGTWVAAMLTLLILGVIPQRYIPERLTPYREVKGRFTGEAIPVAVPEGGKPEVSISINIRMDEGVCQIGRDSGQGLKAWLSMGDASIHNAKIPVGSKLILDPQGHPGRYELMMGPPRHLLAPKGRHFLLLPAAISSILALIFANKLQVLTQKLAKKQFLFLIGLSVLSGAVLYPVAHEGGHLIAGTLFGGTPNWDRVVWTGFSGEEPRASFSHLPEEARPWMTGSGPIAPTLIALLLLVLWRCLSRRASWYVSATLVTVPILFLFPTLGCLFELHRNTHMDALSVHFGFTGVPRVLFSLSPLLVAIAAYIWIGLRFRKLKNSSSFTPQDDEREQTT